MAKSKTLRITQIKSGIGYTGKAKATLQALGLRKMQQTVEHSESPMVRGMISAIPFLLMVEEV